jgi:lipoprotein-anchoring transpeptidase ErfK/SrfK
MLRALLLALVALIPALAFAATPADKLDDRVERAAPHGANDQDPWLILKAEVLLDRSHFSPGEVDGYDGDNLNGAIRAFQEVNGLATTGKLDPDTWKALTGADSEPILTHHTISDDDVAGPFTRSIPSDLTDMAKLPGLSYLRPISELAEKFHMSQAMLRRLNPRADFARPGTDILVANVAEMKLRSGAHTVEAVPPKSPAGPVATTIVVDKPARNLRAYDRDGQLIGYYPATLGSEEKPAPSGTFKVRGVVWNPKYYYDPKFAWKGVKVNHKLTIASGPNNPVGLVWIDLTAPSYGIHGTPAPDDIGKTESHGCVRLTNWDAVDLASLVRPGTVVMFEDEDSPIALNSASARERERPEAPGPERRPAAR